jgi:natural product precursor
MNKNKQTPGKKLSREEMKNLMGGSALLIPCDETNDCPKPCSEFTLKGNYCLSGVCRYLYCP